MKYFHLDSKQTEVERRGDYKLICPLVNWELQVSGSSQQEVQTGSESLRPAWSPRPALPGQIMSWTHSTPGALLPPGWAECAWGPQGHGRLVASSSGFLLIVYDPYLQFFAMFSTFNFNFHKGYDRISHFLFPYCVPSTMLYILLIHEISVILN